MAKKAFDTLTETMFYVLMAFEQGELCGTEIAGYIDKKTLGRVKIGPGTLYTILSRFEEVELIEETVVQGRKRSYRITEKGKQMYYDELRRLRQCVEDAERVVL